MKNVGGVILALIVSLASPCAGEQAPVKAVIGKETAWTGEGVPLVVTLYSPGPFSGTAAFDLPELDRTAFLAAGNPVVGSEDVDGESYFTQRHEFKIYTQNSGEIVVPPFRVRFSGKKTFTADPEPIESLTPELRFQSNRPPGTEGMGIVISTTQMEIQQTWNPEPSVELKAGDVVQRTIARTAEGTTAMMLPPVSAAAPEGVRVYLGQPEVKDKTERGEASARRKDVVKYQFERAGSYTLPALTFVWWDPRQEALQTKSFPEAVVQVLETGTVAKSTFDVPEDKRAYWALALVCVVVMGSLTWFLRKPLNRWWATWLAYYNRPEALAVRQLRAACSTNDARAAYAAMLSWFENRPPQTGGTQGAEDLDSFLQSGDYRTLRDHWQGLSRHLFSPNSPTSDWNGGELWTAFAQMQRDARHSSAREPITELPALNPMITNK